MNEQRQPTLLCPSCVHLEEAFFGQGRRVSRCQAMRRIEIRSYALRCNQYENRDLPSIWDMRQMAWILEKTRRPGFMTNEATFRPPDKDNPDEIGMPPAAQ